MKTRRLSLVAALLAALLAGALGARADDGARAPGDQDALRARCFSAQRTHARRRALLASLGDGALVLLASGRSSAVADATGHRANRDFLYLTGVEDPGCYLLVQGAREVLFAAPRNKAAEIWTGEHVYPGEETAARIGLDAALPLDALRRSVADALERHPDKIWIGGLADKDKKDLGLEDAGVPLQPVAGAIGKLRQVKDPSELALIRRAAEISAAAHMHMVPAIAPGRFEFEPQGLFEGACRFYGAETQGYPSIFGSGPNSCVLHYDKNRRRMNEGDLLVVDAAAECGGYSADVTRTFPVSGKFTPEQRRVYEAVLAAQEAGIQACRPGATVREVGDASRAVLQARGLIKFLPHGVSHWLGLDVHDAGDYSLALAPGMVLTVEPGVYIADKELGVRIEDDILVTEDGPVNLSAYAPRGADEIEALMARSHGAKVEFPPLPPASPLPELRRHKGKLY